jgi:hypothetical protein
MKHNFFDWSKEFGCIATYKHYDDDEERKVPRCDIFFNVMRRFVLGISLTVCTCYLEFEIEIIMVRFLFALKFNRAAWDPEYRKILTKQGVVEHGNSNLPAG